MGSLLPRAFAEAQADGRWRPGIGDPTPLGWLTVAAYAVAAALCHREALREGRAGGRAAFWWGLAAALAMLGINKQLDLQTLLGQVGRDLARSGGWYERRRVYQRLFAGAVAAVTLAVMLGAGLVARGSRPRWAAVLGLAFLVGFILIRASSLHRVDALLGLRWAGLRVVNGALELGGIALIGGAAASSGRPPRTPGRS